MNVDGYNVDVEQLRAHAGHLETIKARFDEVKSASTHIAQDDQAYGLLCGWISAVLEGKHTKHAELVDYVAETLTLVATALRSTADRYQSTDTTIAGQLGSLEVGGPT
ncbi:MAG: type VII secretion target [Kibdelosporangium sp.]